MTTGTTRHGLRRWVVAVVAAVMVAALLATTAAGFRFVQSDPLPAPDGGR